MVGPTMGYIPAPRLHQTRSQTGGNAKVVFWRRGLGSARRGPCARWLSRDEFAIQGADRRHAAVTGPVAQQDRAAVS